ncbi:MAG: ParB N-terminal domain-containing protein [Candidatus Adiutrix sp.]
MNCPNLALGEVQNIPLGQIEPFLPQSYGRPLGPLFDSIKSVGLMHPLLVMAEDSSLRLISGSRRLLALKSLNVLAAPVIIINDLSLKQACQLALTDNQARGWNGAELALLWHFLSTKLGADEGISLSHLVGLDGSVKMRNWCFLAASLGEMSLLDLALGKLDLETASRLAAWPRADSKAVQQIFSMLEPSKQKKKQWLDLLEDLSRRENLSPAFILSQPPFSEAPTLLADKGRAGLDDFLRNLLWQRRNPLLAQLTLRRKTQLRALKLPKSLRFECDFTFEDIAFNLNLSFSTYDEFAALAQVVGQLPQNPQMLELFVDNLEKDKAP